jgi:uncharacterized protein involved in oxidation of intracellular sulfur
MEILIIINDAPYGTEKAFNALRMAMTLQKTQENIDVNLFLLADAVFCAVRNQSTPDGYYNIERMLRSVASSGGKIRACGGCSEARGVGEHNLLSGVEMSNMEEFCQWVVQSDKVITF